MTKVTCRNDRHLKHGLVVRVFGEECPVDRDAEVMGFQIAHAAGCGTPLVALFQNGMVVGLAKGRVVQYTDYFNDTIVRYCHILWNKHANDLTCH